MSKFEMLATIEYLKEVEELIESLKAEAEDIKDNLKNEMLKLNKEELEAGQYTLRYTPVVSNRFDSASFKKVLPEVYKAYTKQVTSKRFTISG